MDNVAARRVGAQFEGLLIEQLLAPLGASFAEIATLSLAPLAQSIAEHDGNGFGALLAAWLERGHE